MFLYFVKDRHVLSTTENKVSESKELQQEIILSFATLEGLRCGDKISAECQCGKLF